ncbi:P-loop containing nucleoside triphosphate hydrolase protein [Amanita muscaria]
MPRKARIHLVPLHSSLINLPMSLYGPLVERDVRPQSLAVHLKLLSSAQNERSRTVEAFVGWTGMAATSSLVHSAKSPSEGVSDTVEIDPQYAQGLGFQQGDIVEIGLLYDLPFAKSVGAEPLTSDDWEIIEIHASNAESILLSQVRVAKIGQEIDVWILGRTRVRLRITNIDPPSKNDALLLTTSTEIAIAPKRHQSSRSGKQTDGVAAQAPAQPKQQKHGFLLRVIPRKAVAAPIPDQLGPDITAYVSPRTFAKLCLSNHVNRCITGTLVKLDPPPDPTLPAPNPVEVPETRVLHPGGQTTDAQRQDEKQRDKKICISRVKGIVDGQIFVPLPFEDVQEWDIVCISLSIDDVNNTFGPSIPELDNVISPDPAPQTSLTGMEDVIQNCIEFCYRTFILHSRTNDVRGAPGILVTGRPGAGKTSVVRALTNALQEDQKTLTYIHYVDVSRYSQKPVTTVKAMFEYWFQKVAWHRPSVLVLDNLDKLLSAEVEHRNSYRSLQLSELFIHVFSPAARSFPPNFRGILLLATATSKTALHALVTSSHIFQEVVNLLPPSKQARREMLEKLVHERLQAADDIKEDPEAPLNFTTLALQTEGYLPTDLKDLVGHALHKAAARLLKGGPSTYLSSADFAAAQVDFVPLSLRDVPLLKSDVTWADIGGLRETRRVLRETLEWPTKYAPIFAQAPLRLRSGLLLYGYPGCGKTLLASAVAKECGLNFISIKGPELLNKYIGASEKSVRDIFERATAAKPCILFFDEFDSIAPKRGHDSTGVTDRVVNQLLTMMDGAEGLEGVYVLAATSRPDLIDAALLRPGRLDKALFCDMPDREDRHDILKAISTKVSLSADVNLDEIAAAAEGYSGADLQALLYNAHLEVVHESIGEPSTTGRFSKEEEEPVQYVTFGGPLTNTIKSNAEDLELQRRLRKIRRALHADPSGADANKTNSQNQKVNPSAPRLSLRVTHNSLRSKWNMFAKFCRHCGHQCRL